jgi:carboxymethylenebutenolidase
MCDEDFYEEDLKNYAAEATVSRRKFGALGLGAGMAMLLPQALNAQAVTESDVNVKTPDGTADCYFVHPQTGQHPGIIIWPDILGLRPAFRMMGKRLAEQGYSVLVVNPFYRGAKAPVVQPGATFGPETMKIVKPLASALNATTHATDARAFVTWLDTQASVHKTRKMGTMGYCMGGPIVMRTAGAMPDRVGGVASFHGGGLVTMAEDSPHLLVAKTKASYLIAIAENDDQRAPGEKDVLKKTFADAKVPAEVEVYAGAAHGWCPPDSAVYNKDQAEKAWSRMLAIFGKALA